MTEDKTTIPYISGAVMGALFVYTVSEGIIALSVGLTLAAVWTIAMMIITR